MSTTPSRIVVTVVGKDRKGIIAAVSTALSMREANILDISQTILQEYFNMIMIVDLAECPVDLPTLKAELSELGEKHGVVISCQHDDIFRYMHRI